MNIYFVSGIAAFYMISCVTCAVLGERYEAAKCITRDEAHDLAQTQNTVAAEKQVLNVVKTQSNITQEASNDYTKDLVSIDGMYASVSVQPPTPGAVNSVPAIRSTSAGACSNGVAKTKAYKLTQEQCDKEEAKCLALWGWAQQQSAISGYSGMLAPNLH